GDGTILSALRECRCKRFFPKPKFVSRGRRDAFRGGVDDQERRVAHARGNADALGDDFTWGPAGRADGDSDTALSFEKRSCRAKFLGSARVSRTRDRVSRTGTHT